MEYLKKAVKFLGYLLVSAWAILVYIGFSIVMIGLMLHLIKYALEGYSLWI
jgi:uncharacterized membrane protein